MSFGAPVNLPLRRLQSSPDCHHQSGHAEVPVPQGRRPSDVGSFEPNFDVPPKDTSQWLAGDGAGGPGTPYLPDPNQKAPGWTPDWPEGVDARGPYSQDPTGTKWYPHPEDEHPSPST